MLEFPPIPMSKEKALKHSKKSSVVSIAEERSINVSCKFLINRQEMDSLFQTIKEREEAVKVKNPVLKIDYKKEREKSRRGETKKKLEKSKKNKIQNNN